MFKNINTLKYPSLPFNTGYTFDLFLKVEILRSKGKGINLKFRNIPLLCTNDDIAKAVLLVIATQAVSTSLMYK